MISHILNSLMHHGIKYWQFQSINYSSNLIFVKCNKYKKIISFILWIFQLRWLLFILLFDYLLFFQQLEDLKSPPSLPCHEEVQGESCCCDLSRPLRKRTEGKNIFFSFFFPLITLNASVELAWLFKNSHSDSLKSMGC